MTKARKHDDLCYTQLSLIPDEEELLEEMKIVFRQTEDKLLRTRAAFMNTMMDALYEALLETDKTKNEFLDSVREMKEKADLPISEKDLPF